MSTLKPKATPTTRPNKVFTVAEANKMLPLIRAIMRDVAHQYRLVSDLRVRLDHLRSHREKKRVDPYGEEVVQNQSELDRELNGLHSYLAELRALGVDARPEEAVCEFPCVLDNRKVMLSWKTDEDAVHYYRDPQRDDEARLPLDPPVGPLNATTPNPDGPTHDPWIV